MSETAQKTETEQEQEQVSELQVKVYDPECSEHQRLQVQDSEATRSEVETCRTDSLF